MDTHGQGLLSRALVGSVAQRVAAESDIPALLVKQAKENPPAVPLQGGGWAGGIVTGHGACAAAGTQAAPYLAATGVVAGAAATGGVGVTTTPTLGLPSTSALRSNVVSLPMTICTHCG
jgi:hypothetical protein